MENISRGQVVLASFPFSDLTSKKLRPCFVIGIAEFNDIVLCQITSNSYESKIAIPLLRSDFRQGTIITDSFIRPDKIATLDRSMLVKRLGTVNKAKLDEVKQSLKTFLEIT